MNKVEDFFSKTVTKEEWDNPDLMCFSNAEIPASDIKLASITNLQHLIDKGVIRFYWETCEGENKGTHYFYTATGLGIMASGDSITAAITNAIENLECQHHVYTSYPTATAINSLAILTNSMCL